MTPTLVESPAGVSTKSTSAARGVVIGLVALCAVLCAIRWVRLDTFWGDPTRWLFEMFRAASGELPYRDFAWQYPPLPILLFGGVLAITGAKFWVVQALLDVISTLVVLLTWDVARRFVPGPVAVCTAITFACAGASNAGNFALFSLKIYTPAILLGMIGILLVIRELADYFEQGRLSRAWLITGTTIALLSKPEFIAGILGCFAAAVILDHRWRGLLLRLIEAVAPAAVVYGATAVLCGPANVLAGIAGYGIAERTCPWWPTGLGVFGAIVSVGYGVIIAAAVSLLNLRHFSNRRRMAIWGAAIVSMLAAIVYLPYSVAELPVFAGKATPVRVVSFFLSTGTILLPAMWIGIVALIFLTGSALRRSRNQQAILLLLLAPMFLISLRGMFGGTMSQLTQVSVAAYPILFIAGPCLMLWFLQWAGIRSTSTVALALLGYAAIRLAGIATEVRAPNVRIATMAGTVRVQDTDIAPRVYDYVVTHSRPGEPLLDVANGGGISFAAHRPSPIFSTQFTALAPAQRYLQEDLTRIQNHPPRMVIANDGPGFQSSYGLCLDTGCTFPELVWRSSRLACDPAQEFPVLDYIRSHYQPAARFGEKVIYVWKEIQPSGQ